jgi:YfiH family protein
VSSLQFLRPDWNAPPRVRAASTLRTGGVSAEAYASLNLAQHVGDDAGAVAANRALLRKALNLPGEPAWLDQVHGTLALPAEAVSPGCKADASWTDQAGSVCVVMTADCLPVLFCDDDGQCVAAAHAGWRGLADGVLQSTVAQLPAAPRKLMAWLGPAIGPGAFEVGPEVRARFLDRDAALDSAFARSARAGHYLADLYALARAILHRAGVARVSGGDRCTYSEADHFFSFRRQARCGRMASLIWLQD